MITPQSYFITGTDTGVGKTLVTSLLAIHFRARGHDAGVMKPMASGCEVIDGELVSEDAVFLKDASGVDDDLNLINPLRWEEPLAPLTAIRRAGDTGDHWSRFLEAYETLSSRHAITLVEGVGGIAVPVLERGGHILTCFDMAKALKLPVIVVARRVLGTINHTVLTVQALRAAGLPVAGIVFCDATPIAKDDIAAESSPAIIAEMTGVPILGYVPYLEELSLATLTSTAKGAFVS